VEFSLAVEGISTAAGENVFGFSKLRVARACIIQFGIIHSFFQQVQQNTKSSDCREARPRRAPAVERYAKCRSHNSGEDT
jgi:hypothetical protein